MPRPKASEDQQQEATRKKRPYTKRKKTEQNEQPEMFEPQPQAVAVQSGAPEQLGNVREPEPAVQDLQPEPAAVAETAAEPAAKPAAPRVEEAPKDESIHEKYERIKRGNLHLTELQNLDVTELHRIAKEEGITEYMALAKQDLIFKILKERIRQNGLMYGEGVLEVLPDGYGFLRSPNYSYLSSPDDVYV
ncbi:MAG: Rho termination factor N-terminal domain-containing protein, partial [Anaerohalosphaeraceae bacterium]